MNNELDQKNEHFVKYKNLKKRQKKNYKKSHRKQLSLGITIGHTESSKSALVKNRKRQTQNTGEGVGRVMELILPEHAKAKSKDNPLELPILTRKRSESSPLLPSPRIVTPPETPEDME